MPPKATPARRRTTSRKKQDAIEIVVRRGALRRFDALKTRTSELPVVVTWDRRTADRRNGSDADQNNADTERRRKPPFTWDVADFVVVEPRRPRKPVRKKATRK